MMAFITIVLLWLATAVNMVSPRFAGLFNGPLLFAGLVPLLLIGTVGWSMFDAAQFRANWNVSGHLGRGGREAIAGAGVLGVPRARERVGRRRGGRESRTQRAARHGRRRIARGTHIYGGQRSHDGTGAGRRSRELDGAVRAGGRQDLRTVAALPLVAAAGMLKALGTLAGWVLLTAQSSRAAADHGLLPQMFARTRAGDTPVAGLMTAGLVGHGSACS